MAKPVDLLHTELELLYMALRSDFGIVIAPNSQQLIQRLHKARRQAMDTDLDVLEIKVRGDEVWLFKPPAGAKP